VKLGLNASIYNLIIYKLINKDTESRHIFPYLIPSVEFVVTHYCANHGQLFKSTAYLMQWHRILVIGIAAKWWDSSTQFKKRTHWSLFFWFDCEYSIRVGNCSITLLEVLPLKILVTSCWFSGEFNFPFIFLLHIHV